MLGRLVLDAKQILLLTSSSSNSAAAALAKLSNFCVDNSKSSTLILAEPQDGLKVDRIVSLDAIADLGSSSVSDIFDASQLQNDDILIIKSLSSLLLFFNKGEIAVWIRKLQSKCKTVVVLAHQECVAESELREFERLATTTLFIEQGSDKSICHITHRKTGGKTAKWKESFWFESGCLKSTPVQISHQKEEADDHEDVTETLTSFNIGTKQSEEKVREQLVLPFFTQEQRTSHQGQVKISGESCNNKIYYEPDSGDDWDDEDPDEDLDL